MPLIDVVIESTDPYLTTTGAVQSMLQTTSTDAATLARIDRSILAASAWVQAYVGYPLVLQRYRQAVEAYGTRALLLARTPVRSIEAIWDSTTTEDAQRVTSTMCQLDRSAGLIRRPQGFDWVVPTIPWLVSRPMPGQEYPAWMVDYTAGYSYDGISTGHALWSTEFGTTSTARSLPYDIEQAVILKSMGIHDGSDELSEEQIGDLRFRYATFYNEGQMPRDSSTLLLEKYRRIA